MSTTTPESARSEGDVAGEAVAERSGSSPDSPASVSYVTGAIRGWIARLGTIWIEGQLAEVRRRRDLVYATLRDVEAESSLPVVMAVSVAERTAGGVEEGQRVLVAAKPEFWSRRGQFMMRISQVRTVGLGELLAQLERLKALLEAEGLFRPERKKPIPFLPQRVGLISGRASDAERDVVTNARTRWPAVEFEHREVAVQGPRAVAEVTAALRDLQTVPEVDVIVIARGGGSMEEMLPFSNEALIRAVADCRVPVVSAIGHEKDSPILDLVADLRASTPTDAGKRIVPDKAEQMRFTRDALTRCRSALSKRMQWEVERLEALTQRRVLTDPASWLDPRVDEISALHARATRAVDSRLRHAEAEIEQISARVRALSPQATMDRGYAVVQATDGHVVRDPAAVAVGDVLRVRVSGGEFPATAGRWAASPAPSGDDNDDPEESS